MGSQPAPRPLERLSWLGVVRTAAKDFMDDDAPSYAAAVAYFALFSLAPLAIIAIAIAGYFYGTGTARGQMLEAVGTLVGPSARDGARTMLENASRPGAGLIASLVSIVVLLFTASNVFWRLKKALNNIWEVDERDDLPWKAKVKNRLAMIPLVLLFGLLLLALIALGTFLNVAQTYLADLVPGAATAWMVVHVVTAVAVGTLVFGTLFKLVPNVDIGWRQVLRGAFVTAVLFEAGRYLVGLYLAHGSVTGTFGAAGSVIVILVWLYYSGMIFFFGAELTQVMARRAGEPVQPDEGAVRVGSRTQPHGGRRQPRA